MSQKPLRTIVFISIDIFALLSWFLLTWTHTAAAPTPKENFESGTPYKDRPRGSRTRADKHVHDVELLHIFSILHVFCREVKSLSMSV